MSGRVTVLDRKAREGFLEEMTFEQRSEISGVSNADSQGRVYSAKGTACAKVLRQECAWCV